MRPHRLRDKLRGGETVFGLCNMYPAPGIVEGMCPGWDFVWIDGQHGQFSYDGALHAVQAAAAVGVESILRTPGREPGLLGQYADMVPAAIMVPMVDDRQCAEALVAALRFPPLGKRSYGGRRVIDLDGRNAHRERELMVLAQIETPEGVAHAPEIAATEGIDMLFFGADDLKCRLGLPIDTALTESELLLDAMRSTARAAAEAGKRCGAVAVTEAAVRVHLDAGYNLLVAGGDSLFLRRASAQALATMRGLVGGSTRTRNEEEETVG